MARERERDYQYYLSQGGNMPYDEWIVAVAEQEETYDPETPGARDGDGLTDAQLYQAYRLAGGQLSVSDWFAYGKPSEPVPGDIGEEPPPEPPPEEPPPEPPPPEPPEPPEPPVEPPPEEDDFSQQLAAAVEAYQQQIGEWGVAREAEAARLGARETGKAYRMGQQALLYGGRTPAEIEQLMAGMGEAGQRSIYDIQREIGLATQQQQTQAAQFGIGTMISGEELGIRERGMAMAGTEYQQRMAEMIRQFNLSQQQQAGQFGQLMEQRRAEQPAWWEAPLAGFAGGVGTALGSWATGKWF